MAGEILSKHDISLVKGIILQETPWPTLVTLSNRSTLRESLLQGKTPINAVAELIYGEGCNLNFNGVNSIPQGSNLMTRRIASEVYDAFLKPSHALWAGERVLLNGDLDEEFMAQTLLYRTSFNAKAATAFPGIRPSVENTLRAQREVWEETARKIAQKLSYGTDPAEISRVYTEGEFVNLSEKEYWLAGLEAAALTRGHIRFQQLYLVATDHIKIPEGEDYKTAEAADQFVKSLGK